MKICTRLSGQLGGQHTTTIPQIPPSNPTYRSDKWRFDSSSHRFYLYNARHHHTGTGRQDIFRYRTTVVLGCSLRPVHIYN